MILVKNTRIEIHGYELGSVPVLEKSLSVYDQPTYSYSWVNYNYDEEKQILCVPRSMSLNYLGHLFPTKKIKYYDKSDTAKKAIFKLNVKARDELQADAINYLLSEGKFKDLEGATQRMLSLATGKGKTYCTIAALSYMRQRGMVIVGQDRLAGQWKDEFLKFTNLNEEDIYIISGSDSIRKIMKDKIEPNYKIFIASHRTLASYAGDDWSKLTEFFERIKIGTKVFDEAHLEVKNIFQIEYNTNTANTIYLTATPSRSNVSEDKCYQFSIQELPVHGLEDKYDDPYHYIYYIKYNSKPSDIDIAKCATQRGFNGNAFADYTFNKNYDQFIEIIEKLIDMCLKREGKIAILLSKNDNILKLQKTLRYMYPNLDVGIFTTLIKSKAEREEQLKSKLILTTEKSLGTAIDVKGLRFLISTIPTSSQVLSEQIIGRLRRLPDNQKSFYFDLTDIGFPKCRTQLNNRRKVLDLKAAKITVLNI